MTENSAIPATLDSKQIVQLVTLCCMKKMLTGMICSVRKDHKKTVIFCTFSLKYR